MVPVGGGIAFMLALSCAAVMGLAIQRGGTCTVAAVEDLMSGGRPRRLLALVEASLWVGAGLLVVRELVGPMALPAGHALTGRTVAGAALLGAGALVNGACVFGAIARLGSGQWAYAATPLGFYAGCAGIGRMFAPAMPVALAGDSPILAAPPWLVWVLATGVVLRAGSMLRWRGAQTWSPHTATAVIGLSFLALVLLVGAWAYTDVLADLARGMAQAVGERLVLAVAVLGGAVVSGLLAQGFRSTRPTARGLAGCFSGGLLMGCGSLLVPGGNDGLVLLAMPLLWPYAWASFAVMCGVIGFGLWWRRRCTARGR